jgi:hypothetical protein
MESYGRLHGEITGAYDRVEALRLEAEERRLVRQLGGASPWRARLAAQFRALAERLEPHPERLPL